MKSLHSSIVRKQFALATMALLATAMMCSNSAFSQGIPEPDGDPIDIGDISAVEENAPQPAAARTPGSNAPQALKVRRLPVGYESNMLQGSFVTQYMQINQNGRRVKFWGARIKHLDRHSPLHSLGLRTGDVITRLDGESIAYRMTRTNPHSDWKLKEMEEHYGLTDVRYIFAKTEDVHERNVDLGPHRKNLGKPRAPAPLLKP